MLPESSAGQRAKPLPHLRGHLVGPVARASGTHRSPRPPPQQSPPLTPTPGKGRPSSSERARSQRAVASGPAQTRGDPRPPEPQSPPGSRARADRGRGATLASAPQLQLKAGGADTAGRRQWLRLRAAPPAAAAVPPLPYGRRSVRRPLPPYGPARRLAAPPTSPLERSASARDWPGS